MKVASILSVVVAVISLSLPACNSHAEEKKHEEQQKVIVTTPHREDVIVTQEYVCLINSQQHIQVCAQDYGRLETIPIKEGQTVKKGDLLFKILPTLYQAKLDAESARVQAIQLKYNNTYRLFKDRVVSEQEVQIIAAELAEATANRSKAETEVNWTEIRAAFDGIVDRQEKQLGSVIKEGEILTNLSDNRVMWVRFNVPEKRYFEFMALWGHNKKGPQIELDDATIELLLASGSKFKHSPGKLVTIEGKFNRETGNISMRADFPNPEGLLRHGQTGTILIHRKLKNALVIPQRATFEILDKRYVYVIGEDEVVHQRLITIEQEMDDIFVVKSGLEESDKIVLEGTRQVHDGEKSEYEFRKSVDALKNQKNHAE